jgi:hypothetical protein
MPVAKSTHSAGRQALIIGVPALLGVLAIVFLVTRFDRLAGNDEGTAVDLGTSAFAFGPAEDLAATIAEAGPLSFQDLARGDRDIHLQHLGDDPNRGWLAFSVRATDADRSCFAQWQPDSRTFVDSCDGTEYPEDGEGLTRYPVSVVAGDVILNLSALDD